MHACKFLPFNWWISYKPIFVLIKSSIYIHFTYLTYRSWKSNSFFQEELVKVYYIWITSFLKSKISSLLNHSSKCGNVYRKFLNYHIPIYFTAKLLFNKKGNRFLPATGSYLKSSKKKKRSPFFVRSSVAYKINVSVR